MKQSVIQGPTIWEGGTSRRTLDIWGPGQEGNFSLYRALRIYFQLWNVWLHCLCQNWVTILSKPNAEESSAHRLGWGSAPNAQFLLAGYRQEKLTGGGANEVSGPSESRMEKKPSIFSPPRSQHSASEATWHPTRKTSKTHSETEGTCSCFEKKKYSPNTQVLSDFEKDLLITRKLCIKYL